MHFGFALDSSDIDLWNIDLLDTHLDLLDTGIPSKYFFRLQDVFKASSRHVFKRSSRHVFKRSSRHVFKKSSRHVFKTSWRCLQCNNFLSSKASWRRLEDVLEDEKLLRRRRVEDVFKTCFEDVFKTSSRPTKVCGEVTLLFLMFPERIVLAHIQSLFERSNRDELWENEGKIH